VQAMNFYLDAANGSMKGGDPGIRLFETSAVKHVSFFPPAAAPFSPVAGEWMVVPVNQIFGSEELSARGPAIAARIPHPFVIINSRDAAAGGSLENDMITLDFKNHTIEAALKVDDSVPTGIAGLSAGLPGMPFLDLPVAARLITKKSEVNA
jgi:NADH-quinone oxidoreductase subunit G